MKKQFSLSRLFHHDKLMMAVSLVLAFVIWSLVVYGPSNLEEREITGVPVSITLNDYASQTLNLRIIEGGNATATVRVSGTRSAISKLTAQDISVTADTGNVINPGTYVLQLRTVSSGDYTIKNVVGDNGTNDTVTITCDVWREQAFPVEVEMPGLTVTDAEKFRFGTPSVSGAAITEGQVTVAGPKTDISRIARVVATIPDEASIAETAVFTADLQAVDQSGKGIESVSFLQAEDAKVSITVPVMVYRKVSLTPTLKNVPASYKGKADLVTITPSEVELWGVPSELEEYVASIQQQLVIDFDTLSPNTLSKEIKLEPAEGVRPLNGSETVKLTVNLKGVVSKTTEVLLEADSLTVTNCPAGFKVELAQVKLPSVLFCGNEADLNKLDLTKVRLTVDMAEKAAVGKQTVLARLSVLGADGVWVNYGTAAGIEVLVTVTATE
ncbi:MAG: hypothetical protein IJ518_06970 [Clostridia bacterium]|nr:hypothetical protein [Clostridia bacterium]